MKHLVILLALALSACTSKPSVEGASDTVNDLQYVKAKNGLCFGTVMVHMGGQVNMVVVHVPCESVGLK